MKKIIIMLVTLSLLVLITGCTQKQNKVKHLYITKTVFIKNVIPRPLLDNDITIDSIMYKDKFMKLSLKKRERYLSKQLINAYKVITLYRLRLKAIRSFVENANKREDTIKVQEEP